VEAGERVADICRKVRISQATYYLFQAEVVAEFDDPPQLSTQTCTSKVPILQILDGCGSEGQAPVSASDLRLSGCDFSSDHVQVVAGGFERLFCVMMRNKSGVVIKGHIALPAETIKDSQQTGMFLVDTQPHKIDDGDVVPRLTSRTESVAEHEPQRSFEHCFVSLLKTSFFVKSENSVGRGGLLVCAREKAFNLRPVNGVRL